MKKIFLFILLFISIIRAFSQAPVIISQPYNFQKYVLFQDSLALKNLSFGTILGHLAYNKYGKIIKDTSTIATLNFNSGLTQSGTNVIWGGTLLSPTTIDALNNDLSIVSTRTIGPNVFTGFLRYKSGGVVQIGSENNATGSLLRSLFQFSTAQTTFTDDQFKAGILYSHVDLNNFTDQSLINKRYADSIRNVDTAKYILNQIDHVQTANYRINGPALAAAFGAQQDILPGYTGLVEPNDLGVVFNSKNSNLLVDGLLYLKDTITYFKLHSDSTGNRFTGFKSKFDTLQTTKTAVDALDVLNKSTGDALYFAKTGSGAGIRADSTYNINKNLKDALNTATIRTNLGVQRRFITNVDSLAIGNGVTDDYAAIAAVIATGKDIQFTANKRYKISAALTLNAGQKVYGNGASLLINHTHGFNMADSSEIYNIRISGTGKVSFNVNEIGIYQKKHKATGIYNCKFDSLAYAGNYADSTVNMAGSGNINYKTNIVSECTFTNSGAGAVTGKRGEYIEYIGCRAQGCDTAIVMGGGNNHITGGNFVYNGINMYLKNSGANDSHNSADGATFNHATGSGNYNIISDSITYCYQFNSCQMFAGQMNFVSSSDIQLNGCSISPRSTILGINNTNSKLKIVNSIFIGTTPYVETGAAAQHNFTQNTLSYTNAIVTPTQRAIDSVLYSLNPATTSVALKTARTIQGVSFDGTANINPINGTGYVKASGTSLSYDNSTFLTTSTAKFVSVDGNNLNNITNLTTPDLNLLTGTQFAYCSSPTNGPSGNGWVSVAQKDANVIFERFFNTTGDEYFRVTTTGNAGWGVWKKILNGSAVIGSGSVVLATNPAFPGTISTIGAMLSGGGLYTATAATFGTNFGANGGNGVFAASNSTPLLSWGASNVQSRVFLGASSTSALTANNGYSNIIIGGSPITVAATGTQPYLSTGMFIKLGTVTNASAIPITNTSTIVGYGASTAGTNNYVGFFYNDQAAGTTNSWFKYGVTRVSALQIDSLKTGVAGTDAIAVIQGGQLGSISATSFPTIKASANLTAQSAAGNITTFTVGATTATFNVSAYINVTAVATDVIQAQVTYTDENNTAQTVSFTTLSTVSNSTYSPITIRAKNATVITLKTNLTTGIGTITFDAGGAIIQN